MGKLMITLSDPQGRRRTYIVMRVGLAENWVDYAIVSPEDSNTNPNDYLAVGYDGSPDHDRNFFHFPPEISLRLVYEFLTENLIWRPRAEA